FEKILPGMIDLVLNSEFICTKPIPLLRRLKSASVSMSQHQASCLLANAFFCTFPSSNGHYFPEINFFGYFIYRRLSQSSKLHCIVNYFSRVVRQEAGDGVLTFTRQVLDDPPSIDFWKNSTSPLRDMLVSSEGLIEKDGEGMLQVDFANKYLGGGVLRTGCVQEEIRFITCPEAIVSCLLTECLLPNECLIIKGIETYSSFTGYAQSFRFHEDFVDCTPRDSWRRREKELVAIDALPFRKPADQFDENLILRELNKSYCGFMCTASNYLAPVATGKWGCGAFRGNPELKALIQLMSASECGRDMFFLTFGDANLAESLHHVHQLLVAHNKTVGE
ncbi:hypothetical protein HELRODRAFT_131512, partial [Helobdella robusta]|uniref:poly(ADP-ribose) glycohydrolase n=1 Tax=Helobdella robusta TaxID=6412 RepID=T1EHV9_HELRO